MCSYCEHSIKRYGRTLCGLPDGECPHADRLFEEERDRHIDSEEDWDRYKEERICL